MKIVLINPPSPYLADDTAYPPSGLMYLAAAIPDHDVEIVDLAVSRDIPAADLYGITCVTPNLPAVQGIAEELPGPTIIGGPHPTFLPIDTLDNVKCDAVVTGEGEQIIRTILADVENGMLRRLYQGGNVPTGSIPKPARHLVNLHRYRSAVVYTSRGCPFNCAFCSKVTGRTYRALPVDQVIEEVIWMRDRGFDHIVFGDDDISIDVARLRRLLIALTPLGITFRLNQDSRDIDDDTLRLAKEAGCTEISFGIESGSQFMLDAMNKHNTVEANRKAISAVKRHGMQARTYFIVNFPGETEETIRETIQFAQETQPDTWLVSAFVPLPGSSVFDDPERYGVTWMSDSWGDYYLVGEDGGFQPCFATEKLSPDRQIYLHDMLRRGLAGITDE